MNLQPDTRSNSEALILILLVLLCFFTGLGMAPLFDVDEGAFSEATREMLESGNYLTTYLNGEPRFDKPILIYWLQALSVRLFGIGEFAFRFPSAAASALWAGAIYLFARRETGRKEAFIATTAMITSLQVTIIGKAAIADALLNCLLAVSMFAIYLYYRERKRLWILLAFAMIGLGTLTKGPIAILIPLAVSAMFFALEKELRAWIRAMFDPAGIMLFLLIVAPWYTLEYLDQGMAFIEGFILKHNVSRFNTPLEQHTGSLWYYFPVVLLGLMPSTGLLVPVAMRLRKLLRAPLNRFLLLWFAFVFIFFSLSGTKLPHYVIYGYTPIFILFGSVFHGVRNYWALSIWPAVVLGLFALVPAVVTRLLPGIEDPFVEAVMQAALELMQQSYTWTMVVAAVIVLIIPLLGKKLPAFSFTAAALIFALIINFSIMPLAGKLMQEPVKEAALLAKAQEWKIVMWKINYPSFLVYSEALVEKRKPAAGEIVFTSVKYLDRLDGTEVLYSRNGLVLARINE